MTIYSLQPVLDYLDNLDYPHSSELTHKKINERGSLVSDPPDNKNIYFEVERHHSILGDSYTLGLAMDAYATYMQMYSFDPRNPDILPVGERRYLPLDPDSINYGGLATKIVGSDYMIEHDPNSGLYTVTSFDTGDLTSGKTKDDVISEFKKQLKEIPINTYLFDIEDIVQDTNLIDQIRNRVTEAINNEIADIISDLKDQKA